MRRSKLACCLWLLSGFLPFGFGAPAANDAQALDHLTLDDRGMPKFLDAQGFVTDGRSRVLAPRALEGTRFVCSISSKFWGVVPEMLAKYSNLTVVYQPPGDVLCSQKFSGTFLVSDFCYRNMEDNPHGLKCMGDEDTMLDVLLRSRPTLAYHAFNLLSPLYERGIAWTDNLYYSKERYAAQSVPWIDTAVIECRFPPELAAAFSRSTHDATSEDVVLVDIVIESSPFQNMFDNPFYRAYWALLGCANIAVCIMALRSLMRKVSAASSPGKVSPVALMQKGGSPGKMAGSFGPGAKRNKKFQALWNASTAGLALISLQSLLCGMMLLIEGGWSYGKLSTRIRVSVGLSFFSGLGNAGIMMVILCMKKAGSNLYTNAGKRASRISRVSLLAVSSSMKERAYCTKNLAPFTPTSMAIASTSIEVVSFFLITSRLVDINDGMIFLVVTRLCMETYILIFFRRHGIQVRSTLRKIETLRRQIEKDINACSEANSENPTPMSVTLCSSADVRHALKIDRYIKVAISIKVVRLLLNVAFVALLDTYAFKYPEFAFCVALNFVAVGTIIENYLSAVIVQGKPRKKTDGVTSNTTMANNLSSANFMTSALHSHGESIE